MKAVVHTDGGNRSTVAACAAVFEREDGEVFERHRLYVGEGYTSNDMEYAGVLLALSAAPEYEITQLSIRSDSQLVVNQLTGIYKVKKSSLLPFHTDALRLASLFSTIDIEHVPRSMNRYADCICNVEMDRFMGRSSLARFEKRLEVCRFNPPSGVPSFVQYLTK